MEVIKKNDKFVRIIIGESERGFKGIRKPIKTICVRDTNVEEVYNKIIKSLEEK